MTSNQALIVVFCGLSLPASIICIRMMMIETQMVAELNVEKPDVARPGIPPWPDRFRYVREYRKLFPNGRLYVKWRHTMWAFALWAIVMFSILISGRLDPRPITKPSTVAASRLPTI